LRSYQNISLLNSDGFWLMHVDNQKVWGFMFDNDQCFPKYHHVLWSEIMLQDFGQIKTKKGLVTFDSICPLADTSFSHQHTKKSANDNQNTDKPYIWKVSSLLPNKQIQSLQYDIFIKFIYIALPLLSALIFISWRLAFHRLKREKAEQQLKLSNQQLEHKVAERTKELLHEVDIRKQAEEKCAIWQPMIY